MFYAPRRAVLVGAAMTLALALTAHADTIFVDADATGVADGSDWDNAFIALQDALAAAAASAGTIDEIRVAGGTYAPDVTGATASGDRLATFQLLDGVAIRGGFAGAGAPIPDARDPELYETILTGDLAGNDAGAPDDPSHGENSLHVANGSGVGATAVLDGVTITAGHANATGHTTGGGILNVGGSPTIIDCVVRGNAATTGAGMENADGSPRIAGCRFTGNLAQIRGGAVRSTGFGSPHFVQCLFDANNGGAVGGAIESDNSGSGTPEVIACTFVGNFVTLDGGAISARRRINVTNSLFVGNIAARGGAIRAQVQNSGAFIRNCTFNANLAHDEGGAVSSFCNSGCTTNTRLVNCVAWDDVPDEIAGQQFEVTFSDIQGGLVGAGNFDADPLFIDPVGPDSTPGTGDEDLRVQAGSPIIDAGVNGGLTADVGDVDGDGDLAEILPIDLDGTQRIIDGDGDLTATVDLGVYEFVPNFAPTADAIVQQLTDIGDDALVRLDGTGSSDVEDPFADLHFEWIVDGGTVIAGPASECAVVEVAMPFGTHTVELIVTDTGSASHTRMLAVSLDAAALSLVEVQKLKVEFGHDPARAKLSGSVGLPFGVDYTEVAPLVLIELEIAGFPVVDPVPVILEPSGDHKWRYRDEAAPFGIAKLDIDWKGARFKFREHGFPIEIESEIIGSAETVLDLKYRTDHICGAVSIDIDGLATIEIDADGVVTGNVPIEVEKPGREVTLALPFPLLSTSVVTITGAVEATVPVADHYLSSVGRFKLDVEFDTALFPDGSATDPRTVDLSIAAGDQFYAGAASLGDIDVRIDGDRWNEQK